MELRWVGTVRRKVALLLAMVVASSPLIVQIAVEAPLLPWNHGTASDYAGLENDVRAALDGDLLVGTSARTGIRNVGPFHGYWSAPWYALTGQGAGGLVVAAWALHAVSALALLMLVRAGVGPVAMGPAAIVFAAAWVHGGTHAQSDFYNPAMTMPAVFIASLAGAAVATGRWSSLPLLLAASSAGAQLHLAAAPGLALIVAVALTVGLRKAGQPPRKVLGAAVGVALAFWSLPLLDQAVGTGNGLRVLTSLVAGGPSVAEQPLGPPAAAPPRTTRLAEAVELVTLTREDAATQGTLFGLFGRTAPSSTRTAIGLGALGCVTWAAWRARRRAPWSSWVVVLALGGAAASTAVTLSYQTGVWPYFLAVLPGYGIAIGVALAMTLLPASWVSAGRVPSIGAVGGLLALVLLVGVAATTAEPHVSTVIRTGASGRPQEQFVDHALEGVPSACTGHGVLIRAEMHRVADVWAVLVALDRRGVRGAVEPPLEVFAGAGHERSGAESMTLSLPSYEEMSVGNYPQSSVTLHGCQVNAEPTTDG